jgi:hypothetical protein
VDDACRLQGLDFSWAGDSDGLPPSKPHASGSNVGDPLPQISNCRLLQGVSCNVPRVKDSGHLMTIVGGDVHHPCRIVHFLRTSVIPSQSIGVKECFNAHICGFHSSQWCFRSEWDQDMADTAFS